MAQNRLLIKGGKVVNADRSFEADVYCENGIISQVRLFVKIKHLIIFNLNLITITYLFKF